MPQVGNKKFPYTPGGIAQAKQAMGRQNKIKQAVGALNAPQGGRGPLPRPSWMPKPPGTGRPARPGYPSTNGPRPSRPNQRRPM